MSETSGMNGANGEHCQAVAADPPPRKRRSRLDLKTPEDVRAELCKVYRAMKLKKVPTQDGTRLTYVLQAIAKVIEGSELARRIESLEQLLAQRKH
jgi:hypothetical protein